MVGSNRLTNVLAERLTDSTVGDAVVREGRDSHVILSESDVGEFYKAVREMNLDTNVWRDHRDDYTELRGWVSE